MKLTSRLFILFTATWFVCVGVSHAAGLTIDLEANIPIEDIQSEAETASPLMAESLIPVYIESVDSSFLNLNINNRFELGDINGDEDIDVAYPHRKSGLYFSYNKTVDGGEIDNGIAFEHVAGTETEFVDIAVADLNGDKKLDVVAVSSDGKKIIYMNTGVKEVVDDQFDNQSFYLPLFIAFEVGESNYKTSSLDVGDINNDGLLDIVFGHIEGKDEMYLGHTFTDLQVDYPAYMTFQPSYFRGKDGESNFARVEKGGVNGDEPLIQSVTDDSSATVDIKLVDINKDGYLDVVTVSKNTFISKTVKITYNNKTIEPFNNNSAVTYLATGLATPTQISFADFDKDGFKEVVVATDNRDSDFYIFKNNAGYQFSPQKIQKPFNADMSAMVASDVNMDGYIDLAASFNDPKGETENLTQVFLNNHSKFLFNSISGITVATSDEPYGESIAVNDMNNDSFPDIVMVNDNTADIALFSHLSRDELPPQVNITGIANNATISTALKTHKVVIDALDQTGINSILGRIFKRNEEGGYGPASSLIDKRDGAIYSYSHTLNLLASDGESYKIEFVVTDMSGNSYINTFEFSYTDRADLVDADGDKLFDQWEVKNGLNKLDPSDAEKDYDQDGLTNSEEFAAKTDPFNKDSDGDSYSDSEEITNSTDPTKADAKPLTDFPLDRYVDEGTEVLVDVYLSANAPVYPVIIDVEIDESSTAQQGVDFEIETQRLVINEGKKGTFKLTIIKDGLAEDRESITLAMTDYTHALEGVRNKVTLTIIEENMAPVSNLLVTQNGRVSRIVAKEQGKVTVSANISDVNSQDSHIVDWSFVDGLGSVDVSADSKSASFDPLELASGVYTIEATVSDSGSPNFQVKTSIDIKVIEKIKSESELLDDDNDGISNANDRPTDSHQLAARSGNGLEGLISTSPGLKLNIGATALAGNALGAEVSLAEIKAFMADKTTHSLTDEIENIGGYYDFDISGLPTPGMTIDIVIPLRGDIPTGGVYRKFNPLTGWSNFVENSTNSIATAKMEGGLCPPAGSEKYVSGLSPFTQCVQLSIEDGGPNDMDGIANGIIKDPGGVAIEPEAEDEVSSTTKAASGGGGGGGGSSDWFLMMVLFTAVLWRRRAVGSLKL